MDVATQLVSKAIIPVAEVVETEAPRAITEDEAKFSAYQVGSFTDVETNRYIIGIVIVIVPFALLVLMLCLS